MDNAAYDLIDRARQKAVDRIILLEEETLLLKDRIKVLEEQVQYLLEKDPLYMYKKEVDRVKK